MKGALIAFTPLILAACISPHGDQFARPDEQILEVPEIGTEFTPIPLKIAVYVSPQAANGITYDDRRNLGHPIVDHGRLGPAIVEAVAEYFPRAFADASLISEFPSPAAQLLDADAVLVFETGAGSIHMPGGGMTYFVDTLLDVGIYSLQGEREAGYRVISTSRITAPFEMNMYRAMQIGLDAVKDANKSAVRLALHKFPRGAVVSQKERMLPTAEALSERSRRMHAAFAASAPKIPGPTVPAMVWIDQMAKRAQMMSTMSSLTSAQMASMPGVNPSLNTMQQGLHRFNMNYATNPDAASGSAGLAFMQELLGGLTEEARRRKAAQDLARAASAERGSPEMCQEFARLANKCRVNQRDLGGGTTGQAGSFNQCAQVYENAYNARCR